MPVYHSTTFFGCQLLPQLFYLAATAHFIRHKKEGFPHGKVPSRGKALLWVRAFYAAALLSEPPPQVEPMPMRLKPWKMMKKPIIQPMAMAFTSGWKKP